MFQCQNEFCGEQVKPRQPVNRIVVKRRQRVYKKPIRKRKYGEIKYYEDVFGSEIVEEIQVCPKCYRKLTGKEPKMQIAPQQTITKPKGFNTRPPKRKKKWQTPKTEKSGTHAKKSDSETTPKRKVIVEKVNPLQVVKE